MPGTCLISWQTDGCDWSIGYLWRSWDWVERGILISLGLMLAYTVFIVIRFSRRYYMARPESRACGHDSWPANERSQRKLIADLSRGLRAVKAIASAAPFLGLAGTNYGILAALSVGVAMEKNAFLRMMSARTAATLVTAAAGLLVAIPAILAHNILRTRVEMLQSQVSRGAYRRDRNRELFQFAQKLPLLKRFSGLPAFAVVATPALAGIVCIFLTFEPYVTPTGLPVGLVSDRCELEGDRPIVLRIRDTGGLFINHEKEDWKNLADRLSQIYRIREHHTLYVLADDGVPFQAVGDAIDIAENSLVQGSGSPDIAVWLITPRAMQGCLLPVVTRSGPDDSK